MREQFDSVWVEWFEDAASVIAKLGSEIGLPRRCKHQKHRSNIPADTARYDLLSLCMKPNVGYMKLLSYFFSGG